MTSETSLNCPEIVQNLLFNRVTSNLQSFHVDKEELKTLEK